MSTGEGFGVIHTTRVVWSAPPGTKAWEEEQMRKIKAPPGQRSVYGATGLPAEYVAKKMLGEEGMAKVTEWAKDPTAFETFDLYSFHHPSGQAPLFSANDVTVKLRRIGHTLTFHEFFEMRRDFYIQSPQYSAVTADLFTFSYSVKMPDEMIVFLEDTILRAPEDDPFLENTMEEL